MHNIVGRLDAASDVTSAPTIVLVAYYDSFAAAPVRVSIFPLSFLITFHFDALQALSRGADANAGGVAAILELMRILRQMYAAPNSRPQYNIIALLSAGGRVGYLGTRHWIETYHQATSSMFIGLPHCLSVKHLVVLISLLVSALISYSAHARRSVD